MESLEEAMERLAEKNRKGAQLAEEVTKKILAASKANETKLADKKTEANFIDPTAIVADQKPKESHTKTQKRSVTAYVNRLRQLLNMWPVQVGALFLWVTLGGVAYGLFGIIGTFLFIVTVFTYESTRAVSLFLKILWILLILLGLGFSAHDYYMRNVHNIAIGYFGARTDNSQVVFVFLCVYGVTIRVLYVIKSWINAWPKLSEIFHLEKFKFSFRNINFVKLVLAVLMCVLQYDLSDEQYSIIRFVGMVGFSVIAYNYYKNDIAEKMEFYYVFWAASAILINPIFKAHLGREMWNNIDFLWCFMLVVSVWNDLKRGNLK